MPDSSEAAPRGTSRRDVLRRGGIVVGLAWTAPVVQSMLSPAFATGSEAGRGLCDRLIFIKWRIECSDRKSYWVKLEDLKRKTCYLNMLATLPNAGLQQPPTPPYLVKPATILRQTKQWAQLYGDTTKIYAAYDSKLDQVTIKAPDDCRVVAYQVFLENTKGCPVTALQPQPFPQEIKATGLGRHKKFVSISMILCCND